jgi:hypothetical protein
VARDTDGPTSDLKVTTLSIMETTEYCKLQVVKTHKMLELKWLARTVNSANWDIIFADDWKDEPKNGEYWKEFGVKIGVGFHIVSELSSHRYLDVLNQKNFVIKTPNGRSSQTWYFDWYTKTIKNAQTGKSMNIDNNGKGPGMIMMNTNSKWW